MKIRIQMRLYLWMKVLLMASKNQAAQSLYNRVNF